MLKNCAFQVQTTLLCIGLLLCTPLHAAAQCTCCEQRDFGWLKELALFSGAAAAGVIAGILAGNNSKKHCHCKTPWQGMTGPGMMGATGPTGDTGQRGLDGIPGQDGTPGPRGFDGARGPMGMTGPAGNGFIVDPGQTLTISLVGIFPTVPQGTLTAIAYITLPDGTTIEGGQEILEGGSHAFNLLTVNNPVLGTYSTGIQITNSNQSINGITLNGSTVTSTKDGLHTVNLLVPLAGNTILTGESLISTTFIYDAENIP
jgi:hypothetical protein